LTSIVEELKSSPERAEVRLLSVDPHNLQSSEMAKQFQLLVFKEVSILIHREKNWTGIDVERTSNVESWRAGCKKDSQVKGTLGGQLP